MTGDDPRDRPAVPGPGTQPRRLAPPWPDRDERDTGPLSLFGDPAPASGPAAAADGGAAPAAEPATTELEVPATESVPAPGGRRADGAADTGAADDGAVEDEAGAAPARGAGRAGRDLVAAVGVGLVLSGVILASLLVYRPAFLLVLGLAVLVSVVELGRALQAGGAAPPLVPVLVGALAMIALAWTRGPTGLVVGFLLTVLAVLLWRLGDGPDRYLGDASAGILVALYVPLLAGFAVLLLLPDDGATRVVAFIATVVGNDVGGYAAGVLFGRHPMAPSVSPKKSWEGMAGSIVTCVLVATPIVVLGLDGPWWGGVLFGAALAVTATLGDLGESLIKRDLGIKDMGTLLPGHGGLMDRMDSLLPSAAVAYLLLSWVAPA